MSRTHSPYSPTILASYTRDVARWPRPSVSEQRADLVELTDRRARLWREVLGVRKHQAQLLRRCTESGMPPLRRVGSRFTRKELDAYASELAMTPNNADLLEALAQEISSAIPAMAANLGQLRRAVQRQRNLVVNKNLRLVFGVARRFKCATLHLEDLLAEGNLGLMRAVDRFDIRHDVRFSTYAIHWIRHAIGRMVDDQSRTVRVPVHARTLYRQVARARSNLHAELGREPTDEEVAKHVHVKLARVRQSDTDMLAPLSIDEERPMPEGWGKLGDTLADDAPTPDEVVHARDQHWAVRLELAKLAPDLAKVIRQRYGLGDDNPMTLQEIGAEFGLSRERIRQIQVIALSKLRQHARCG